jgi:putative nucleotidyltransferase with HDIG domain
MTTLDIDKLLNRVDAIPSNFHIAIKVAKMLDDFNVNIQELSKIIGADQSFTVQLLKLCNSAQYGFSRKIVTVNDAITRLGFKTLKSLVFVVVSKGAFNRPVEGYDLAKGELWRNSISCAVYSKYLAETSGYKDPDLAFTAGLLRDIGKLIIHEYVKEEYNNIVDLVNSKNIDFSEAEEKVLGYNHSQVGAKIAAKWNFPKILEETIEFHHNPEKAKTTCMDKSLINIVHIADSIAMMLGIGIGNDGMMHSLDINSLENIGIDVNSVGIESLISDMVDLNTEIDLIMATMS